MSLNTHVDLTDQGLNVVEATVESGGEYRYLKLSDDIKNLEVHQAQGEGDKWFIRALYANGCYVDYFNIIEILWGAKQ